MSDNARPLLFYDRGCPSAHRVLALLELLGQSFEPREAPVGVKPDGHTAFSPSGLLPLLVHGSLVLSESRLILEHLAEYYGFVDALPAGLNPRSRHRHAMAIADTHLARVVFGGSMAPERLAEVLDSIERTVALTEPSPCLLALHLGPLWWGFRTWNRNPAVNRGVEQRPALHRWLTEVTALPCIERTAHDPNVVKSDFKRAREAGLLPAGLH